MNTEALVIELTILAETRLTWHCNLLTLTEEQRKILVSGRIDELNANIAKQDAVVNDLVQLDKHEVALIEQIGQTGEQVQPGERYTMLNNKTADAAKRLKEAVMLNKQLLNNALQFVKFSIASITRMAAEQQGFDSSRDSSGSTSIILDSMA